MYHTLWLSVQPQRRTLDRRIAPSVAIDAAIRVDSFEKLAHTLQLPESDAAHEKVGKIHAGGIEWRQGWLRFFCSLVLADPRSKRLHGLQM
eukprot:4703648-Prymnesium_polylepis.1